MTQEILDVARKCAARYKARVWWADLADLQQEASLAAFQASKTFDAQCGVPFDAYAWRACVLALRRWCWRASAPVSEAVGKLDTLRGVYAEVLDDLDIPHGDDAHALLEQHERSAHIQSQFAYVLSKLGDDALIAERVIAREEPPARVAASLGVPPAHVYRAVRRARHHLTNNAMLYSLWRDQ